MYYLSVGAIFKNECIILQEWIEHYLFHGVEHFFLIDDTSTDNFQCILEPYIEKGIVTLFQHNEPWTYYLGRQKDMYNHFIFPQLHKTKWLAILDIDEYLWSPISIDLREPLKQCEHLGQLQIKTIYFGSNGYIEQPNNIVASFTKRSSSSYDKGMKYIIHTSFSFQELTIHYALFTNKEDAQQHCIILGEPYFRINHYCCQSLEYWNTIKCTRGDGDNYRIRTPDDFFLVDINEIEDLELSLQNK